MARAGLRETMVAVRPGEQPDGHQARHRQAERPGYQLLLRQRGRQKERDHQQDTMGRREIDARQRAAPRRQGQRPREVQRREPPPRVGNRRQRGRNLQKAARGMGGEDRGHRRRRQRLLHEGRHGAVVDARIGRPPEGGRQRQARDARGAQEDDEHLPLRRADHHGDEEEAR